MKKQTQIGIVLILNLFPAVLWAAGLTETTELSLGEQTQLSINAGARYSVGNPEILSVRSTQLADGKSVLLVRAKAQGYSDLLLIEPKGGNKKQLFHVVSKKQGAVLKDVHAALSHVKGLELTPQGDKWIAQGYVRSLSDFNLLQTYVANGSGKIIDRTRLDPMVRATAEVQIQRLFRQAGLGHFTVHGIGSQLWLEGAAGSKEEKEIAEALAHEVFASTRSGLRLAFEIRDILRFHVQILEMVKSKHSNKGLEWGDQIPSIVQMHQQFIKGAFSIEATLQMLEQKGLVKILSKPEIALNSEGVAELKVGGEIPIALRSMHFAGVQWKPYGLTLRLETPGVARELARTNVTVEISTLDHANASEGIPATKLNRMQTVVDLSLGKTIFLSGLMQNSSGESSKELPGLSAIPIFGELFKSKEYQEQRSELVMAITAVREENNANKQIATNM